MAASMQNNAPSDRWLESPDVRSANNRLAASPLSNLVQRREKVRPLDQRRLESLNAVIGLRVTALLAPAARAQRPTLVVVILQNNRSLIIKPTKNTSDRQEGFVSPLALKKRTTLPVFCNCSMSVALRMMLTTCATMLRRNTNTTCKCV